MENETQVVEYNITDAALAEMSSMYMGLEITDLEDKEQFDAVHSAHMVVKGKRIEVDKKRKELKADALAWGNKVQSEANRIFALIEPIESHLKSEKQKVQDEKDRIENERISGIKDEINSWEKAYLELNSHGTVDELRGYIAKLEAIRDLISPELYFEFTGDAISICNELLAKAKQSIETRIRLDREEADRKAEDERLAVEREKQAKEAAKLLEEREKLLAAQKKIDEEKAALEAEKKSEQERKDREEFERKAKKDAEEKAARGSLEKAAYKIRMEKEAAEEVERQKALLPDKEKLVAFSQFLSEGITYPTVDSTKAQSIIESAAYEISEISEEVFKLSQKM